MTGDGTNAESGGKRPDPVQVRAHLKHVLTHPDFAAAPQLSAFLTYIVERQLEGAEDRIKAYSIATEALGRPASFDPQNDPIVRVQARRLRQALQGYYSGPQADDTVRIGLPVGGYSPEIKSYVAVVRHGGDKVDPHGAIPVRRYAVAAFAMAVLALGIALWSSMPSLRTAWDQLTWTQPPVDTNPLGMPSLAVAVSSERLVPTWFSPQAFVKGVELNLSRFDEFVVLAPAKAAPAGESDYRLDLDFSGTTGAVLGTARLMRGSSGRIVWTNRFTIPEDFIDGYELLEPSRRLSSVLGQPYGVLYAQLLGDPAKTPDQSCLLRGYEWFQTPERDAIDPARLCLEDLLVKNPGNHIAHILLAYLYTERFRNRLGGRPSFDLAHAYIMARRSVALRPDSAGSQQVLMEVQSARGNEALALEAGQRAVELNPNDSDVLADYGCRLIFRARYSEGLTYAERAARWNELPPPWHRFCLFTAKNNTGKTAEADAIARSLEGEAGPQALIPVAIASSRRGDPDKAKEAVDALVAYDASFASDPRQPLTLLGIFPEVAAPLIDGLRKAGLKPKQ